MINKNISEYNVSITDFSKIIGQDENGDTQYLVDNYAIIGYDQNLKSWYLNAFLFDKNQYELSLPRNGDKFKNVLSLLENLEYDTSFSYVINHKDLDGLIKENTNIKLHNVASKLAPYCYGNHNQGNSDLIKLLERRLQEHIRLTNVQNSMDKINPSILHNDSDNIIYNSIIKQINFLNAQISLWGKRLSHLSEQERIEIAQTYTDVFELKNKEHRYEVKSLSNFYHQWYDYLIN